MTIENYIINIHTTGETALVFLSKGDEVLGCVMNHEFKEHAKFLHPSIKSLLERNNISSSSIRAVSVTNGPGSYTGIRVGLAAAKGFSYALNIPLITINTLEVLAASAILQVNDPLSHYCAMIDARRMEVYTAIFNYEYKRLLEPMAVILDTNFPEGYDKNQSICFFGSGSYKFRDLIGKNMHHYTFAHIDVLPEAMAEMSFKKFQSGNFSDVAYAEPEYLKDFNSTANK